MPRFSNKSKSKLYTCHPEIVKVFEDVIKYFDCTILEGHRGKKDQDLAYAKGNSKVKWPDGRHNKSPSNAVDAIPYPIDWEDRERMTYFAGWVLATAKQMGFNFRWGGDWDKDTDLKDNKFDDLVHFERKDA
jgi:peptidoglycan L-alanyl-D-glutamate endopeptidase CwlK|tara:strand:+ start:3327 stop:3722 length:396 start_codon:yes stop_codon:yes gene_type:complete